MGKLATPDWVKEGFDSKADWLQAQEKSVPNSSKSIQIREKKQGTGKKAKTKENKVFKLRLCSKCGSDEVNVVLSGNDSGDIEDEDSISNGKVVGEWECKKCKWHGKNVEEKDVTEEEFMEYLDKKGEEVS